MPLNIQNTAVSITNTYFYKIRHGGKYRDYRQQYFNWGNVNEKDIIAEQQTRLKFFLQYAKKNSQWYYNKISQDAIDSCDLSSIPILEKKHIIENLETIQTLRDKDGVISLTGGTTGSSMKVIYTKEDMQERFAILDNFRAEYGYELGKKTAWFSGKNLISEKDISKGICSHYDFINKIRFYSTFYINKQSFDIYWKSLIEFKPEFVVGFPSSVYEICRIADSKGLRLNTKVKVFFPTAETVLPQHREVIGRVLGCKLVDQYASSEGAPFILECTEGNLHIHPLTGIFEVVDKNLLPSVEGELLVTSFTTKGTPLIRYHIGDNIKLSSKERVCPCGSSFPLIDKIQGRSTDYLVSPTHGKVNLGNLSNSTKNVSGIIKFQAIQDKSDEIKVLVVANSTFDNFEKDKFKSALNERFGPRVNLVINIVEDIPNEKSGKFRIIKNNLNLS